MAHTYSQCLFFAERTSAHKGAALAGTVIIVAAKLSPDMLNGDCIKSIGVPKDMPMAVPTATWVSAAHLARRCVQVTESDARRIAPHMFASLESFDRDATYREGHAICVAEAIRKGRYSLQSADDNVNARLAVTRPVETSSGFRHH